MKGYGDKGKEGETGREYRQGGGGGGDTGELFDHLDYFFTPARISTEVYGTSRLQKTGAFGPEECHFEKSKRVSLSNQIQCFRSGDL